MAIPDFIKTEKIQIKQIVIVMAIVIQGMNY